MMVQVRIPYLHEVDGQLHYRRRIPGDLQAALGKSEWKHALGLSRGQEAFAARLVADYNLAYAGLIARERVRRLAADVSAPPAPSLMPEQPDECGPSARVSLKAAYAYDIDAHGGDRNERAITQAVENFVSVFGDADILTLTPRDVQQWINSCTERGQKASTVQRRINALRAIIGRYYRDHEIERTNPFSNPRVKGGNSTASDRLPFHTAHLDRMDRYFARAPRLSDEIRQMFVLLKLTGARPLEIGGLAGEDVILDHTIPHLWIRNNGYRRIKTKGSERRIPLVGEALTAARELKRASPIGPLFSPGCHETNSLSQRLNKLIRRAGVPKSPRLVVYSFRHTLEEALRAAGTPLHTQQRIMGHTDQSMTGRYGAPAGLLEELCEALLCAEAKLGKTDISIYAPDERIR